MLYTILAILAVLLFAGIGIGLYFYFSKKLFTVPYPTCNAGDDVWKIQLFSDYSSYQDLLDDLVSRKYEMGPAYNIYIKNSLIGSVSQGKFTQLKTTKITPGGYLLTPVSDTNLCQSSLVRFK